MLEHASVAAGVHPESVEGFAFLGRRFVRRIEESILAQQSQAISQRVHAGRFGHLVDEAVDRERMPDIGDAPQPAYANRNARLAGLDADVGHVEGHVAPAHADFPVHRFVDP